MESEYLLVYVTFPDEASAVHCARRLVAEKLAAGVNIIPGVRSIYSWAGQIRDQGECVLLAQVAKRCYEKFESAALLDHPYEVPCVIAMNLDYGHQPFLAWIKRECQSD